MQDQSESGAEVDCGSEICLTLKTVSRLEKLLFTFLHFLSLQCIFNYNILIATVKSIYIFYSSLADEKTEFLRG